jgi:FkbM family methyltransferase
MSEIGTPIDIKLGVPRPAAATWLDELARLRTAEAMREAYRSRYPAFEPARLTRLAIVGAGPEGQRLANLCAAHGISLAAIVDDSPAVRGARIAGCGVAAVESLATFDRDLPVVIASHRPLRLIERLHGMGFSSVALFVVLQILAPDRFPPHMFYDGWLEDLAVNGDRYRTLGAMFGDDLSRRHLDAIIGFRLTADIGALAPVIDWEVYYPRDLFELGDDEVYVDGGTYDGDTIRLFIKRVGGRFSKVIGFEPDPATFERLKANFEGEPRVQPVNKGLYDATRTLRFANDASRASIIGEHGDVEVPVTRLDDVLGGERVTFIKMNIEGAELRALRGARESINRWVPRLAISAYHRPSDLWQVPFLIHEIEPRYSLHLRQQDAGVIETVAYALPR